MLPWICFGPLLVLLVLAALTDVRERRIPNWLTGSIAALYPVYVLASPAPVAWPAAAGIAGGVFLVGLLLFARQVMGGGDVKLIAALSLWAGLEQFALFALVTTLTGGALALITLWWHRWGSVLQACLASFGLSFATAAGPARKSDAGARSDSGTAEGEGRGPITLPYGIAIAAGGIALVVELMKL